MTIMVLFKTFGLCYICHEKYLICNPTMHGMVDAMFFDMYKQLIYPHLVGWMSQIWYIPTWLGDECMYDSLVIGRSLVMYV